MDQSILMHANIDEGAESRDIGDHAFQHHAGLQVRDLLDPLLEGGRLERRARIAAGFFKLLQNIRDGGKAEGCIDEVLWPQGTQGRGIADQHVDVALGGFDDAPHDRIGFGMHARLVKRVITIADAQKTGAQLERLGTEARHVAQRRATAEGAVGVTVGDDILRKRLRQSRHAGEQGRRGGIHIDANGVHAILHHGIERT